MQKPELIATKLVLGVKVMIEKWGERRFMVSIDLPHYTDKCYWWEFDIEGAKSLFDCINEDKVFMLTQARTPAFMRRIRILVGVAIGRRYGLPPLASASSI